MGERPSGGDGVGAKFGERFAVRTSPTIATSGAMRRNPVTTRRRSTSLRSVRAGRKTIPLAKPEPLGLYAGLPWGSTVELSDGTETLRLARRPKHVVAGEQSLVESADPSTAGYRWKPLSQGGILTVRRKGMREIAVVD